MDVLMKKLILARNEGRRSRRNVQRRTVKKIRFIVIDPNSKNILINQSTNNINYCSNSSYEP